MRVLQWRKKKGTAVKKLKYEELREAINAYFAQRSAKDLPPTVTGLALALGFSSREELTRFKDQKRSRLIQKALMKIENNAEEKLFTKEHFSGAKLFLEVNFSRWSAESREEGFDPSPQLQATGRDQWAK